MNTRQSVLVVAIAAAIAGGAQAQSPDTEEATEWNATPAFAEIDIDRDGSITTSEAQGTWLAESFALVDANKDGIVDEEEYNEAMS